METPEVQAKKFRECGMFPVNSDYKVDGKHRHLCFSGYVKKDKVQVINYTACFAELNRLARPVQKVIISYRTVKESLDFMTYNGSYKVELADSWKEGFSRFYPMYYDWLFNHSPWKDAYITKDVDWCEEHGVIFLNPEVPANLMYGAAIATRFPYEKVRNFLVWCLGMEMGFNPNTMSLIAHNFYVTNCNRNDDCDIYKSVQYHVSIRSGVSGKWWSNYIKGKAVSLNNYTFNEAGSASVDFIWGSITSDDGFLTKLRYKESNDNYYIFFNAESIREHVFPGRKGLEYIVREVERKYA